MSSKVIDFDTNRKHIFDFLLVHHSNLGPILHLFGDIAGRSGTNRCRHLRAADWATGHMGAETNGRCCFGAGRYGAGQQSQV